MADQSMMRASSSAIIHVLKVEQLNRRSGDDHAVEALVLISSKVV